MKSLFRKISAVLGTIRVWSVNLLTLIVLVYIVGGVAVLLRQMPETIDPQGKVLILSPEGTVVDQQAFTANLSFPFAASDSKQIQSRDLVRLIRAAAADQRLAGVLIDFGKTGFGGPSTALTIATELAALRDSGKPVIAYSESLGTSSYLMAAQAQEIYVHPSGAVAITGVGGYRNYMRELTEKLRISIHNYSQGDFKSAADGISRNSMSDADRLQQTELYIPIWDTLKARMAQARGLDEDLFQEIANDYPVVLAREAAYDNLAFAQENNIINGTMSFPQLRAHMIQMFGKAQDSERETYPHIGWDAYLAQLEPEPSTSTDDVAVVFVEGVIRQGEIAPGVAGSDDIAALIRRAHESSQTRAIVLRVNSPGGSIIASDVIRDELEAAKLKGLPVVVSMGDVAASGGVWVSTSAQRIYAEPTSITGSIGVAIAFPTVENIYDYAGIHLDGVTTSDYAGWDLGLGVDERLDAIFARWASSAYARFIDLVATSRGREPEYIRSIAGGRVWSGERALELGLIDELGGMEDAIAAAAASAQLEQYHVNYVTREPSPGQAIVRMLLEQLGVSVEMPLGAFGQLVNELVALVEDVSQPRATVMCTDCMVELQ